ncbi:hypothetical protein HYQ55_2004 [Lactobacillus crispatus]|nr:hypothetical protein [Lactobacillus crispatus]
MKSKTQFDQEKDTESLISAFSKLIGLPLITNNYL